MTAKYNKRVVTFNSILPWKMGVCHLDIHNKLSDKLDKVGIPYRVKEVMKDKNHDEITLKYIIISKKDLSTFRRLLDRFFDDLLIKESFDYNLAIQEVYDRFIYTIEQLNLNSTVVMD